MSRNARRKDPRTSHATAFGQCDQRWAAIVRSILASGTALTDEEIHRACQAAGIKGTDTRTRHGRKHLEKLGMVKCIGKKTSSNGRATRVWSLVPQQGRLFT